MDGSKKNLIRIACAAAATFSAVCLHQAAAADEVISEQQIRDHIRDRFKLSRPAVTAKYDVSYRFMGINLMKVAVATIESAEGTWRECDESEGRTVCVTEFRFETIENGSTGQEGRVYLRDSMLCVLTMPDLNTLWYMRRADERISIPLVTRKRVNYLDTYNLESGSLRYYREDYIDGSVVTNLPGIEGFADQGRDISSVVKLISSIYYGRQQVIDAREPYMIKANINGTILPLAVTAMDSESPVRVGNSHPCAIKISVRRVDESGRPGAECFVMWASSFRDVAGQANDEDLSGVVSVVPEWSMVPLVADYDLCLGSIRCSMTGIGLTLPEAGPETAGAPVAAPLPVGMIPLPPR